MNLNRPGFFHRFAPALLIAALAAPLAHAQPEKVEHVGAASFVSGGVGETSMKHMKSMEADFNLKMLFAHTSGAYMSDVKVTVSHQGKNVFETTTEGPILLVKLPAGHYAVTAEAAGETQKKEVTIAKSGRKNLDFRWAREH